MFRPSLRERARPVLRRVRLVPRLARILVLLAPLHPAAVLAQADTDRGASGPRGLGGVAVAPASISSIPVRSSDIELDGYVDEEAWLAAPVLPMVQHWPEYGADRTARTRIRVLHDEDDLWLSGRMQAAPDDVRGVSLQRDRWAGGDAVDVLVDGRNDDLTGFAFSTTPLGTRIDSEIRNDASSSGGVEAQNVQWNGVWEVRSRILPDGGWSFEMRIPLEILGIPSGGDLRRVGLMVSRYHAVGDERDIFPAIPPDWDRAHLKPSLAHDVELPSARPGVPLFVTPYVLAGAERTRDFDATPPAPPETGTPLEVGGDVRVGLGPSVTLDLTVNTDFAQAESDDIQVNLDRFNLFFPEKRQFFQERASTFDFQMGPEIRLFHSRRVGLDPDGTPRRIWGGARLTGTVGDWDLGVMSLQVDEGSSEAGENDAVVRARRTLDEDGSQVGGMVVGRLGEDGDRALAAGLDGVVSLGGDDFLTLQVAATEGDEVGPAPSALERSAFRVFWERRRIDGLHWAVEGVRSGTAFQPVLGFESRDAFSSLVSDVMYAWRPSAGPVARYLLISTTRGYWRTGPGTLQSALQRLRTQISFRNGFFWNTALNLTLEDVEAPLTLPGASVPAGRYRGADLFTNIALPNGRLLGGTAVVHVGTAFDGWRVRTTLAPRLDLSRHLTVSPELEIQRLVFPDRSQHVRADRVRLRLTGALDTRWSGESFVQYDRVTERLAAFVRFRLHLGEGRDIFLVYDGVRDIGEFLDPRDRVLGRADGRLLLKVTHTWRW